MKIHVGNLSMDTKNADLQQAFEEYGAVTSVNVIEDKVTKKPKGFAFVEMTSGEEAAKAISGLNEQTLQGNAITVSEARSK